MDKVIATLHSVEERAQHIMDAAANEKLSLKEYIESKKRAYEKKVNDATDITLSELSATLQQQFDNEFNEKKSETEKFLKALSDDFEQNHTKMAEEIFRQIIEV